MEKIKQALERARHQQKAAPVGVPAEADEQPISYTKTRVLQIDQPVLRRNRVVAAFDDKSDAATAYKILRTQVEQRLVAQGWNAVAVTSPRPGSGKTLTAVNLAVALAREVHRTVLLVDLDLHKPSVLKVFGHKAELGLVDYLVDGVPLGDILVNPGIDRLVILPAGKPVPNSSELIASPRMAKLVEELKTRYPSRIVIFDLPPLLSADDTLAFSPYTDTVLLVVEDDVTTRDEIVQAMEMLSDVHVLGSVLNKAAEVQPAY